MITITVFHKTGGALTKRIHLDAAGQVVSDGSECRMAAGTARRVRLGGVADFAQLIVVLQPDEAIALGAPAPGLPDQLDVVTQHKLASINGMPRPDLIARCRASVFYIPGQPAFVLLDYDPKGMPREIAERIEANGGFWKTLIGVFPELQTIARLGRRSTSAGISRTDTDEQFPASGGVHLYLVVKDGADAIRFLTTLHERLWLEGYGWYVVGKSGQLLERSIVDRMVASPERLVFEGPPVLDAPLVQDHDQRRPHVVDGEMLDTVAVFPPLTNVERARFKELKAKAAGLLKGEAAEARRKFIEAQAQRLVDRLGMDPKRAAEIVRQQCGGVLFPHIELPFDDDDLAGTTVADVLADPKKFEGATLADPLEGVGHGRNKAVVLVHDDGSPWVYSFAHGRTVYELRYDMEAVRQAIGKAAKGDVVSVFVRLMLSAHMDADAQQAVLDLASKLSGIGKRAIAQTLKAAVTERNRKRAQALRDQRLAERTDPRPQLPVPAPDAEWLPQMATINEVLAQSRAAEPPMRDGGGYMVEVHNRRVAGLHELTAAGSNQDEPEASRLPAPEQPLRERLEGIQVAELIERHIDYVDAFGRSVHLPSPFVGHYVRRRDQVLPFVNGVATLPIVLPGGALLSGRGLDRRSGIVFRVAVELERLLPRSEDCTPDAIAQSMHFLCDNWLCDVAADYSGKCIAISLLALIVERYLLPERPGVIVSAGQRGTGKTTLLHMVSRAALGVAAAAAAWSTNEEERRKALFAYFLEDVPFLIWDNIPRGLALSCPSIERSLTSATYSDRVLGVSKFGVVNANTIQGFTGNNIFARGDLASRVLNLPLFTDLPDPENRKFEHPDPLGWTLAHRGQILRALYTILLGNPALRARRPDEHSTRFKRFMHLVGSAVEHAAGQHLALVSQDDWLADCRPADFSFKDQFLAGERDDDQTGALITVLSVMRQKWPVLAMAHEVSSYCAAANEEAIEFKAALEQANGKAIKVVTTQTISARLKALKGVPVPVGKDVLILRYLPEHEGATFKVEAISPGVRAVAASEGSELSDA